MDLRRLEPDDNREAFSCGDAQLDAFFRQRAGQNLRHRANATYVIVDGAEIAAFVTVVPGTVRREDLDASNRRLPAGPLPVLLLARMGVGVSRQKSGFGAQLLRKVMELAAALARDVGCIGVVVDAKHGARAFYERFDFRWLDVASREDVTRGFLPIQTIEAALVA